MKMPIVYEIAGNRRCLIVEPGQRIVIGRSSICDVVLDGEEVRDVEAAVNFIKDAEAVIVDLPDSGRHEHVLPFEFIVGGFELRFFRPTLPAKYRPQEGDFGLTAEGADIEKCNATSRSGNPILLGANKSCDFIIQESSCPLAQLALWPLSEQKVYVQVLDDSSEVDWVGRGVLYEAELPLPTTMSVSGNAIHLFAFGEVKKLLSHRQSNPPSYVASTLASPLISEEIHSNEVGLFFNKDGKQLGPFGQNEVLEMLKNGKVSAQDLAWKEGTADWLPLYKLIKISSPPPIKKDLSPSQPHEEKSLSTRFPAGQNQQVPKNTSAKSISSLPFAPNTDSLVKKSETIAIIALLMPLGGAVLNLFWVGNMNLLQGPGSALNLIMAMIVVGTAILIGVEAGSLDMGGPNDPQGEKATSPIVWGIATVFFWIICFPAYMFKRSKYGVKNRIIEAVLIAFLYCWSATYVFLAIEDQKDKVRRVFHMTESDLSDMNGSNEMINPISDSNLNELNPKTVSRNQEKPSDYDHISAEVKTIIVKAESGDASSQSALAVMYANGQGVTKDEAEALKWMRKAAAQNDARAQRNLYTMLGQGLGVPRDEEEALKWLKKAVEQGDAHAQFLFGKEIMGAGILSPNIAGLAPDFVKAYAWVQLAILNGYKDEEASQVLSLIEKRISPQQKNEALKFAQAQVRPDLARTTVYKPTGKLNIGENFQIGDFSYIINSVKKTDHIGTSGLDVFNALGSKTEKANMDAIIQAAKQAGLISTDDASSFLIVNFKIKNEGKEASVISTTDFKIIDFKGRTFTTSAKATTELVMNESEDYLFSELQPGMSKKGIQAFELPKDSFDGKLTLIVPEKGFLGSEEVRVEIDLSEKAERDATSDSTRQAGFLGVQFGELKDGRVFLHSVLGGAAQDSGLLPDDIVLNINSKSIASASEAAGLISQLNPGDIVEITIIRNNETGRFKITLGKRPLKMTGWLGVHFGDTSDGRVRLLSVGKNTPADAAGLLLGDEILKMNSEAILNSLYARAVLNQFYEGESLELIVKRDGKEMRVNVVLGPKPAS